MNILVSLYLDDVARITPHAHIKIIVSGMCLKTIKLLIMLPYAVVLNTNSICILPLSQDSLLANQTARGMRAVFAPKTIAARQVLSAAALLPLQSTVLFSSVAGQLGSAGQANYGAANAALDAMSDALHTQVGRSINIIYFNSTGTNSL